MVIARCLIACNPLYWSAICLSIRSGFRHISIIEERIYNSIPIVSRIVIVDGIETVLCSFSRIKHVRIFLLKSLEMTLDVVTSGFFGKRTRS